MAEQRDEHFVKSFERGLAVLRTFATRHRGLTLTDVAHATDMTLPAARRFLSTLVELGYLRQHGQHFTLTPRVLELGNAFLSSLPLPQAAKPHLRKLADDVQA